MENAIPPSEDGHGSSLACVRGGGVETETPEALVRSKVVRLVSAMRGIVWGGGLAHEPRAPVLCAFPGTSPPDLTLLFELMGLSATVTPVPPDETIPGDPVEGSLPMKLNVTLTPREHDPVAVDVLVFPTNAEGVLAPSALLCIELDTDALACSAQGVACAVQGMDCADLVQRMAQRRFTCIPPISRIDIGQWVRIVQRCVGRVSVGWSMEPPKAKARAAGLNFVVNRQDDTLSEGAFCAISQENIPPGQPWVSLGCGHDFDPDKLLVWVAGSDTAPLCPLCKAPVIP